MNNIYKNKIFYILSIIVKAAALNFYCLFLSIKKPSCKCVPCKKHGIENCTKFEYRNQIEDSQHLVIINSHPSRSGASWTFQQSQVDL